MEDLFPDPYSRRPWLDQYPASLRNIEINPVATIGDEIDAAVFRFAERTAFIEGDRSLSYRSFGEQSTKLAAEILRFTKNMRQPVAILLPNSVAFVSCSAAIAKAGMIQVAINPLYTSVEVAHQIDDTGARILVSTGAHRPIWQPLLDQGRLDHVVVVDGASLDLGERCHRIEAIYEIDASGVAFPKVMPEDIALLQYTGGTTGVAKAAMLTHANLMANQLQIEVMLTGEIDPAGEIILTALPLYHIFAFSVNFLFFLRQGATNILIRDPRDAHALGTAINAGRPTVITGVNTLFAALNNAGPALNLSSVRLAVGGGAAVQDAVNREWCERVGRPILEGYGLSETSPLATMNPPWRERRRAGIGVAVPGTDIAVLNEQGEPVPLGEIGEICIAGPQVMKGYWQRPEETEQAFFGGRWFRSGDLGYMEEDGQLIISDRRKDLVLVSGLNVYPNEVEAAAVEHPCVMECACIGRPDPKSGEAVLLFVTLRPGSAATPQQLREHCRTLLAPYKVPAEVFILDSLPKSPVGKILRKDLRGQYLT
jgi:long-chain acyl-CoA synthetase